MPTYRLSDLIGSACMTHADGALVFDAVKADIVDGRPVTLDFSGVYAYSGDFILEVMRRLADVRSINHLHQLVAVKVLDPKGVEMGDKAAELMERLWRSL